MIKGEMVVFQSDWDELVHQREELRDAARALLDAFYLKKIFTAESGDESAVLIKKLREAVERAENNLYN